MPNNTISLQVARQKQEAVKLKNRHDDMMNRLKDKHDDEVVELIKKQKMAAERLDESFFVTLTSKKDRFSNVLFRMEKIHNERVSEMESEQEIEIDKLKKRNEIRIKDMQKNAEEMAVKMRNDQKSVLKAYQDMKLRRLEQNA